MHTINRDNKMIKKLFYTSIFLCLACLTVGAQTKKTDVLVVGNSNAAVAAAIQSAISGVKTTLLLQAKGFDFVEITTKINSGLTETFLQKYHKAAQTPDSLKLAKFDKQLANVVLAKWTDSVKNLTVIKDFVWTEADAHTNSWSIKISNGETIKAKILINTNDEKLNARLKITAKTVTPKAIDYSNTIYRTSVAGGMDLNGTSANYVSLYDLLLPNTENLVWVSDPKSMLIGQAAGATAAYAAFFDTKVSLSNLKKIQGELINYKLNLMPFSDIKTTDTNWKAIQFVGLTGVIKSDIKATGAFFNPEKAVTTEEIKQPFKDHFYKAQIWFDDYKMEQITIGSAINLICYVGNKDETATKKQLTKNWKTSYQFKTDLDFNRQITRRELAVILQDYAPPFNVFIDKVGKIVR